MARVQLAKPDVAMWSDLAGTRVQVDILQVADPEEEWDSTLVWFDDGTTDGLPVEYRGVHRTVTIPCRARFTGDAKGHEAAVALDDLFRRARRAPDGRLQLRTNEGLASGMSQSRVVSVPRWDRSRVIGQVWDIGFTATALASTLPAPGQERVQFDGPDRLPAVLPMVLA